MISGQPAGFHLVSSTNWLPIRGTRLCPDCIAYLVSGGYVKQVRLESLLDQHDSHFVCKPVTARHSVSKLITKRQSVGKLVTARQSVSKLVTTRQSVSKLVTTRQPACQHSTASVPASPPCALLSRLPTRHSVGMSAPVCMSVIT